MNPNRELIIVGGPNGAGKTTFAKGFLKKRRFEYLSADLIAAELAATGSTDVLLAAGREFLSRLSQGIERGDNLLVESTLSGRTLRTKIEYAIEKGYRISVIYIFLSRPTSCIERVKLRVRTGGHDVPATDIIRRFQRSVNNFWNIYRTLAHQWLQVYNGGEEYLDVSFGVRDFETIHDPELHQQFRQLMTDENPL